VAHAHLRHRDAVARAPEAVGTPDHIEHHFDLSPIMGAIQRSSTKLGTCVVFGSSQPEQPTISSGLPEYCATGKTRPYATWPFLMKRQHQDGAATQINTCNY
jgi:hypothetical protein